MNIINYDPFRDMRNLQDEVNRLLAQAFRVAKAATTV
jgi:hypothetical protein